MKGDGCMAGSVGLVQFEAGDEISSAEFRERLNAIAQQGADATAWNFGFGLIGAYTPGTGFTLAVDEQLVPPVVEGAFLAQVTAVDGAACSWVEVERAGVGGTWSEKEGGRAGFIEDEEHEAPINAGYEINGREGVAVGTRVVMWPVSDTSGVMRYQYDLGTGLVGDTVELGDETAGADDALGDSWERSDGVSAVVWFVTRVCLSKAGPVYGYKRALELDSNGHVYRVSAETRYEIDETESCVEE
jgi:hypothetical protein